MTCAYAITRFKATGARATGVIAQEVLPHHPDMVHKDAAGMYLVDEPSPWKLVKTIQGSGLVIKQQAEIDALKATVKNLVQERTP